MSVVVPDGVLGVEVGSVVVTVVLLVVLIVNLLLMRSGAALPRFLFGLFCVVLAGAGLGYSGVVFHPYLQLMVGLFGALGMLFAVRVKG